MNEAGSRGLTSPTSSRAPPGRAACEVDSRRIQRENLAVHPLASRRWTLTEHRTAICMRERRHRIVHRTCPSRRRAEVDRSSFRIGMIVDPITMAPEQRIQDALDVMRRYGISGVPITRDGKPWASSQSRLLREGCLRPTRA